MTFCAQWEERKGGESIFKSDETMKNGQKLEKMKKKNINNKNDNAEKNSHLFKWRRVRAKPHVRHRIA